MRAILTFQGFRESNAARTGTEDAFYSIIRLFASSGITTYHPKNWTADVKELAHELARQGIRNVALVSYSHGQAAAVAFAKFAYTLGISTDLWLACDPVYRPTFLPRWNCLQPLAFRAMLPNGKITVPRCIRRVAWVRQKIDLPRGHDLIAEDPTSTHVADPLIIPLRHTLIDHAPRWVDLIRQELTTWANPPAAIPVCEPCKTSPPSSPTLPSSSEPSPPFSPS
jgi:hypothetical protein